MARRARSAQDRRDAATARRARRAEVEDPGIVMEAAATFLGVRQRSVDETRRRLKHLGYPPNLIEQVIDRLIELEYLDDHAFGKAWIESRDRARPRGEVALRRELQLKGLADQTIRELLAERSDTAGRGVAGGSEDDDMDADTAAAYRLLDRRASMLRRETDPRRRRQKAYALLARSGFAPDVCQRVAASVNEEQLDSVFDRV